MLRTQWERKHGEERDGEGVACLRVVKTLRKRCARTQTPSLL
jgi:hypothetical protein